ncbi:helix-turn-helix domain-containing protein [Actinosynnema mirum]|uniref:HTH cro/C1-type domain-containing protein n=1 Tax=Actinosynnema mirum (strain ATCC 29888 / DSM 43827 / JCM 3225 / NBRC 14064 / NCIMB 13271 / NRRL B-12336 / IMRU 3971 / 101) TaxID=446462 RepID=C6WBN7_ACTMD|nr:helix-turn-helix transcriptional regulator [Actinosynnema mirum]ACU35605.1 hypothetical protein Amir_1656 [Actinosynnema mirum DSM 43827]
MSTLNERVAQRVKAMRQRRGMSMQALADAMTAAGYPSSRMGTSNREAGRAKITLDEAEGYCTVFGIAWADLIGESPCTTCDGAPPAHFTCNNCGKTGQQ